MSFVSFLKQFGVILGKVALAEAGIVQGVKAADPALSPTVDKLLDEGRALTDQAKRRPIYAQAFQQVRQDLPLSYLYNARNIVAMTAKLQGFRPVPDGMIRLQGLEMAR